MSHETVASAILIYGFYNLIWFGEVAKLSDTMNIVYPIDDAINKISAGLLIFTLSKKED